MVRSASVMEQDNDFYQHVPQMHGAFVSDELQTDENLSVSNVSKSDF